MKKFLSVLTLCICALFLVGCSDVTTTTETTKEQTTENKIDAVELTAGDSYDITFWHIWGKSKSEVLDAMIAEFQAYMKDTYDVTVNIVSTSQSNYPTLLEKTNKAIAAGSKENIPTLVIGYPDHFASYLKSDSIVSLDPYIDSTKYGVDESDFISSYMDENNQFGGITYSLPFSKSAEIMAYNKSITDDLGITIPYDKPITWDTLISYASQMIGYNKNYADIQYILNYDSSDNLFINFARQLNAKYTTAAGELLCTDSSTITMVQLIEKYIDKKYLSVPINYSDSASYGSEFFQQQKMVFTIGSTAGTSYNIPTAIDNTTGVKYLFNTGIAMVPQFTTGVDGNAATNSVVQQGPNICMLDSGTSEESLVAWLFVKYMLTMNQYDSETKSFVEGQNNSARFAISTNYFPVTYTAFESTLYSDYMGIAKKYLEAGYDDSILTAQEKEKLVYSEVAYIGYLQNVYYKYDPAFAATKSLLGSASIRTAAGDCINKVAKNTDYDAQTALEEMLKACTVS